MGQATRTTKLLLDFSGRSQGGANPGKREHLAATVEILNAARRFYLDFFLTHPDKLTERVEVISKKTGEVREGVISADNLLTWAEFQELQQGVSRFPESLSPLGHEGCDWQSTRLSHHVEEMAEVR